MNYLYFTEADLSSTAATGEGAMYPASSFLGLDPIGDTTTSWSYGSATVELEKIRLLMMIYY